MVKYKSNFPLLLETAMTKLLCDETLGENIKRIRLARGLTQEQTVARLQDPGFSSQPQHLFAY